jgi:hypothetical protein
VQAGQVRKLEGAGDLVKSKRFGPSQSSVARKGSVSANLFQHQQNIEHWGRRVRQEDAGSPKITARTINDRRGNAQRKNESEERQKLVGGTRD